MDKINHVKLLESFDFNFGKKEAAMVAFANFPDGTVLDDFLSGVTFPRMLYTPSFHSEMQDDFAYRDYAGLLNTTYGEMYVIEGVREKRDGVLAIVFSYKTKCYALIENKVYDTTLKVGRYEVCAGKVYAIDYPASGFVTIGGSIYEVIWEDFTTVDTFGYNKDRMEGVVVLVSGVQFKWKEVWTLDLKVLDADGVRIKVMDAYVTCGAAVKPGDIVEIAVETMSFVRVRPDKKSSQSVRGILNAMPFSFFYEAVERRERRLMTKPNLEFCPHTGFYSDFLKEMFDKPRTWEMVLSYNDGVAAVTSCAHCHTLCKMGNYVTDLNNRLAPRSYASLAAVRKDNGDTELFDYYSSVILGDGFTFQQLKDNLGLLPLCVRYSKGYDFLLDSLDHTKVVEFCGPRINLKGKVMKSSNDLFAFSNLGDYYMFPSNIHSLSDKALLKFLEGLRPGTKVLLKTNDAVLKGDILRYYYVSEVYYSRRYCTYNQYLDRTIIHPRSKSILDGLMSQYCYIEKETRPGYDNLKMYSQVWVKRREDIFELKKALVPIIDVKQRCFVDTSLLAESEKLAALWPFASPQEINYWASRLLEGVPLDMVPIPKSHYSGDVEKFGRLKTKVNRSAFVIITINGISSQHHNGKEAFLRYLGAKYKCSVIYPDKVLGGFNHALRPPVRYTLDDVRRFLDLLLQEKKVNKLGDDYELVS